MSDASKSHIQQAHKAAESTPVRCGVLTVSDTRTAANDVGGDLIVEFLAASGHETAARGLVPDEPPRIAAAIEPWLADSGIHAVITTGGTGIAKRDTTIEVVRRMLTIELEGFGELFRMLSYQQVGGAAMLSRAVGGLVIRPNGSETLIFSIPGSPNAVETAMKSLIAPQLAHLVWERRR
jgi:molybdopterin adenylyltransferase